MIITHKFPMTGGHRLLCYPDGYDLNHQIETDTMNAKEAQEMAILLLGIVQDLLIEHKNKNLVDIIEQVISAITHVEKVKMSINEIIAEMPTKFAPSQLREKCKKLDVKFPCPFDLEAHGLRRSGSWLLKHEHHKNSFGSSFKMKPTNQPRKGK